MSSNWDGQRDFHGNLHGALGNLQAQQQQHFGQQQSACGQGDRRTVVQISEAKIREFDEAASRAVVRSSLDAILDGVPGGPVREAWATVLLGLVTPLLAERRAKLVAELVAVAKQA